MKQFLQRLFAKEALNRYLQQDNQLGKHLRGRDLIALGVGSVIGTGIFILPGTTAALYSGPAVSISFVLAAIVCSLSAMCYAELASALPVAGSAYSFGSILFGELIGWVLGWAMIMEYVLAIAAVSTGFSAYLNSLFQAVGITLPDAITHSLNLQQGHYINLLAVISVLFISSLLLHGLTQSVHLNNIMVILKLAIIVIFIVVGSWFIKPSHWTPFLPYGSRGVFKGATMVFFAYLGFDVVSGSAAEVKHPARNLPLGILGTLGICTVLYIGVAVVLTGMVPYQQLDIANPVAFALNYVHLAPLANLLALGALFGMFTMMMATIYSSSRLIYSIGRDGLLPRFLSQLDPRHHQPLNSLYVVTVLVSVLGGLVPLDSLTSLVNIGTLFSFALVSLGVFQLRHRPDIPAGSFRVPFYPVIPLLSFISCVFMLTQLDSRTWWASLIWLVIGLVLYFTYGLHHSQLHHHN